MRLVDAAVPLVAEAQLSHALLSARTYKTAATSSQNTLIPLSVVRCRLIPEDAGLCVRFYPCPLDALDTPEKMVSIFIPRCGVHCFGRGLSAGGSHSAVSDAPRHTSLETSERETQMPTTIVDVAVPAGVGPGDIVSFQDASGSTLEVTVPEGLAEGDVFQVAVNEAGAVHPLAALNAYVQARAASGDVMDKFVAWFEREEVGAKIDRFVELNAATIGSAAADQEQSLDWWPLYQAYQTQFDELLQEFLDEAQCTAEEFLAAADGAEGMNNMYLKLFLAHSDYQVFIDQMGEKFREQKALGRV